MADTHEARSVPQLLSDLTHELTNLVRKESELVRAEVSEKTSQIGRGAGELAAGGICLLAALLVLLQALVVALSNFMDPAWAALLVGVAVAILGAVLVRIGMKNMQPRNLTPDRTIRQAEKDAQLAKDQVR